MAEYIGITIGPIFDTLNLTSSPAALWAASYMFSSLTRNICKILTSEYNVSQEAFVSPYYSAECDLLNRNDGVGLFHDRIIFRKGDFDSSQVEQVREKAIKAISRDFKIDFEYLNEYIMVSSVEFKAENPILESAQILDCMELSKPFVFCEQVNPILSLFNNDGSESKNEAVKKIVEGFDNFQLIKKRYEDNIIFKSLSDIVGTGKGYKRYKYYAIVRSDGDNMSKIISSLNTDGEVNKFSKTCLEYCANIAKAAAEYNGVAIYAGGDDLLAILPCVDKESRTPFDFIIKANSIFKNAFEGYGMETSLSFGITMAYYKFPLYEALEDSANLLFGIAKKTKNCAAVHLQKHAGQSACLLVSNDAVEDLCNFKNKIMCEDSETLLSAMHKLSRFEDAFLAAKEEETVKNLFINTFDAASHKDNVFVHKTLPEIFNSLNNGTKIFAVDDSGVQNDNTVLTMNYILRMLKFFIEKDGGKE